MSIIRRPNDQNLLRTKAVPVEDVVSDEGTIDEGAMEIGFLNSGSADATINGEILGEGESKSYPCIGKQYIEIAYNATGTTLRIVAVF